MVLSSSVLGHRLVIKPMFRCATISTRAWIQVGLPSRPYIAPIGGRYLDKSFSKYATKPQMEIQAMQVIIQVALQLLIAPFI